LSWRKEEVDVIRIPRPKFRITTKILLTLLGLSLVSIISFTYIALSNMTRLGDYALESSTSLGASAVSDSSSALQDQVEEHLFCHAKDQATISNTLFEKVEAEVDTVTAFASSVWSNPSSFGFRPSYSREEEPDDIYATSVYMLVPGVDIDAVREELNLFSNLDDIFIPVYASDPNLTWVYIATESGIMRLHPWTSEINPSCDHRVRPYFTRARETGEIGWSEPYIGAITGKLLVTCTKPFYDSRGELVGVVGADMTVETINQRIINIHVGELGYAFLLDNHGHVIVRPGLSADDKRWDESFETENLLESDNPQLVNIAEDMTVGNSGISTCRFEDGEKYIAYAPITCANWSIGIVMPVEEIIAPALATESHIISAAEDTKRSISSQISDMRNTFIGIFVAMIFVVSGIAYLLSRRITRPILALDDGAKIVGSGNLDHRLEVRTGDEIEDLANTFNKMTDDLKAYMKELQETTAAKERIESDLRIATEIQTSMLPRIFPPFPDRKEFDIFAAMNPAKEVGGDFYDFFFISENELCLVIGDVCGKGIPAALFMAISKTLIKTEALRGLPPDQILFRVNNILYPDNDLSMFFTGLCVILNTETGEIKLANGGHNPPLISIADGKFEFVQMHKSLVVAVMPDTKFESQKLTLKPNDVIFMYTDGVTEAMDPEGQLFSDDRLKQFLTNLKYKNPTDIINATRAEIEAFAQGIPQYDDITMLALRFNG